MPPKMFKCAKSNGLFVLLPLLLKNVNLSYYPLKHVSQINKDLVQRIFTKAHITHHVLKRINMVYIQMPKLTISKLNWPIFFS